MYKTISLKVVVNVIVFFAFSFTNIILAEYLSFFSPKDDVNFHIKRAIDGAMKSIDLAITDIKSREIAESFVQAHKKGVSVRILFSKKELIGNNSQLRYLLENGIKAWVLEDKSINVDNFAIFDKRLLLGGSFRMDQEKYQSITFTDDKNSLQEYQMRFDGFANLKLSPAENIFSQQSNQESWQVTSPQQSGQSWKEEYPPPDSRFLAAEMVDLSFDDMYRLFGRNSTLGRSEKKRLWKDYKGKFVVWTGKISYVAWGLVTGNVMTVTHTGGNEVTVNIKDIYVNHVKRLHKGDSITYRGRLAKRPKRFSGFKLRDGEVMTR